MSLTCWISSSSVRPEGDLVADLVEVAHRLRAFAVQAADRQADLLQAAEDLVDLPRDDQGRQVQHHAHPHAGADVGGAGRQVAQPLVEGVGDLLLDQVVDAVDLLPDAVQVQPALHHLDAQVVLLVDHQAELLVAVDGHGAGALALGVLAADQVPLDEELAVDLLQLRQVDVEQVGLGGDGQDPLVQDLLDLGAVLGRGPADEGEVGQVAGQADAAADDDVGLGPGAPQPFAAGAASGRRVPRRQLSLVLDPLDFVAQFRGPLVVLVVDGFLHLAAEADQLGALLAAAGGTAAAACPRAPTRRGCSGSTAPVGP